MYNICLKKSNKQLISMLGFFFFLNQLEGFFLNPICFNFDKVGTFILLEEM